MVEDKSGQWGEVVSDEILRRQVARSWLALAELSSSMEGVQVAEEPCCDKCKSLGW